MARHRIHSLLGAFGPKFLNGFLELALSIAQSPKLRTAILPPVANRNALHVAAQVLSYLLDHREVMVSGFLAIGRGPTAAREQNTCRYNSLVSHPIASCYLSLSR